MLLCVLCWIFFSFCILFISFVSSISVARNVWWFLRIVDAFGMYTILLQCVRVCKCVLECVCVIFRIRFLLRCVCGGIVVLLCFICSFVVLLISS